MNKSDREICAGLQLEVTLNKDLIKFAKLNFCRKVRLSCGFEQLLFRLIDAKKITSYDKYKTLYIRIVFFALL